MAKRKREEKQKYYNQLPFNTISRQICPSNRQKISNKCILFNIHGTRNVRHVVFDLFKTPSGSASLTHPLLHVEDGCPLLVHLGQHVHVLYTDKGQGIEES